MRLYHLSDLRSNPEQYQTPKISFSAPYLPVTMEAILNYLSLIEAPLLAHRYTLRQFDTTLALLTRFYGVVPDISDRGGIHFDASRLSAELHESRHETVRRVYREDLHRLGLGHAVYAQARAQRQTRLISQSSSLRPENHGDTPSDYLKAYDWTQTMNRLQSLFNPLSIDHLLRDE